MKSKILRLIKIAITVFIIVILSSFVGFEITIISILVPLLFSQFID